MEYTSESAVIRAGNSRIKSPFGASAWQTIVAVIKQFIGTTRFWLPLVFYAIILISLSIAQLYIPNIPNLSSWIRTDVFYTTAFVLTLAMLVLFSLMTVPFLFKGIATYEKSVSEQIGITSYWGLIVGKYIGMFILYLMFTFSISLLLFSIDVSFSLGSHLIYSLGKTVQNLVFGALFSLTWGSILISIGVFFLYSWQTTTFIVGFFAAIFAFLPLQTVTHSAPESTSVVVIDEAGKVSRKSVISHKQANDKYNSVYWLVAPFNSFAATSSMVNVFDGNFTKDYRPKTSFDTFFNQVQKVTPGEIFHNPIDYSILYPETASAEWNKLNASAEFGREKIDEKTKNYQIVEESSYDFANLVISNETVLDDVKELSNTLTKLIDKSDYLQQYKNYVNEKIEHPTGKSFGNYYEDENGDFVIPPEIFNGKYLSFVEYIQMSQAKNNDLKVLLEDISTLNNNIFNTLNIKQKNVGSWNYLYNQIVGDSVPFKIPLVPIVSNEEAANREAAHKNGNVGVMNQTLYSSRTSNFVYDWIYILGLIGLSTVFFIAATPTIMSRNYF